MPGWSFGHAPRHSEGTVPGAQDPGPAATRFSRWRLRSRWCAAADVIAALAGAGLFALAAVDSVASWLSNRVLLAEPALAHLAGAVLLPGWPWMMASSLMVFGLPRRREPTPQARLLPRLRTPGRIGMAVAAAVCAAVIAGGAAAGAAKGSAQILAGPRYEVSTVDLNDANWTRVTAAEYQVWQARYVREDGVFTAFGLLLAYVSVGLLRLHRAAGVRSAQAQSAPPSDPGVFSGS